MEAETTAKSIKFLFKVLSFDAKTAKIVKIVVYTNAQRKDRKKELK